MIVVHCQKCAQPFRIKDEQRKQRIACPRCGQAQIPQAPGHSASTVDSRLTARPPAPRAASPTASAETAPSGASGSFINIAVAKESSTPRPAAIARKSKSRLPLIVTALLALAVLGVGGGLAATLVLSARPPRLAPVADRTIVEQLPLAVTIQAEGEPSAGQDALLYSLVEAPEGATVDASRGVVTWTPTENQGPRRHRIVVRAAREDRSDAASEVSFWVDVEEANRPPSLPPLDDQFVAAGAELVIAMKGGDPDRPAGALAYRLGADAPAGAALDEKTGRFSWRPGESDAGQSRTFTVELRELGDDGLSTSVNVTVHVRAQLAPADTIASATVASAETGASSNTEPMAETPSVPATVPETTTTPAAEPSATMLAGFTSEEAASIFKLQDTKQLFKSAAYPALRKVFADRFEREHAAAIDAAWGDESSPLRTWLAEHRDLAEELFLAIDPAHDKIEAVLDLFKKIHERYPKQLAQYGNLAIAVAVAWDDPAAIYDYEEHRVRAKAKPSEGQLDGLGNFDYFLKAEGVMEGRARFLPWEFLVYVVNHRTPQAEREWAVNNYVLQRSMIGRCYSDAPYDHLMLSSNGASARLNDQAYHLPNLKQFGGVCAHQADYASRVSQSLGVPAAYVSGQANSGDHHAWVMWVELKSVTAASIGYSLESHGRYNIDNYYVGQLVDPHTGQTTTDRELELRLHTVGLNYFARRQAELLMGVLPLLREQSRFGSGGEMAYLSAVIQACPGCETAWFALAELLRNADKTPVLTKQMNAILEQMFVVFAAFPDFTWRIFDEMIAFEVSPAKRINLYERLVAHYEGQKRPDLACEARLALTDLLVAEKKGAAAIEGLAYTIKKFPDEGRHVPRMLDKLEEVCASVEGSGRQLTAFYDSFLPLIPPKRGDQPSQYCLAMYQRGIDRFQEHGELQLAQAYLLQLNSIRAGGAN